MSAEWPDKFGRFEEFLSAQGLSCQRRETTPRYGEKLAQYGNGRIAVRILSERGVWWAEVADIAGRPDEWYDAAIVRDLIKGRGEDVLPITEQMRIIEDNWSAIADAFAPANREETHKRLDILRNERAKRRFPKAFS